MDYEMNDADIERFYDEYYEDQRNEDELTDYANKHGE